MPLAPDHSPANFTEAKSTLTATAATIFAANPNRRGVILGNPSDTVMTFRIGATADANSVPIAAGTAVKLEGTHCPSGLVSMYCAGSSKAYCCYEW